MLVKLTMNSNDVSYFSWADGCVLEIWGEKVIINALNDIWIALRAFDEQALTFASIATGIYLLVIIFINIIRRIRNKKPDSLLVCMQKVFVFAVFMVYMSYLISLTLSGREAGSRSNKVNLLLFGTFRKDGSLSRQSVENVLLFVPFGILVPMFTRLFRRWWNLVLMAFAGSLFVETTQLITARGYFELDDIVFNTFGAFLGYIVFSICYHSLIAIKRETKIPLNKHEVQINRVTLFLIQLLPVIFMICLIFSLYIYHYF